MTAPAPAPNLLGKFDIEVYDHQNPDGTWMPVMKVKAALGFVEFAVKIPPDLCRAVGKALTQHAEDCEKKLIVPKPVIAQA